MHIDVTFVVVPAEPENRLKDTVFSEVCKNIVPDRLVVPVNSPFVVVGD